MRRARSPAVGHRPRPHRRAASRVPTGRSLRRRSDHRRSSIEHADTESRRAPGRYFMWVARPALLQLCAVKGCDLTAKFPEAGPGGLSRLGFLGMLGWDIQGLALAVLAPREIQIWSMAADRVGMTRAVELSTGSGSGR